MITLLPLQWRPEASLWPSEFTNQSAKQPSAFAAVVEQSNHNIDCYITGAKSRGFPLQERILSLLRSASSLSWFIVDPRRMLLFHIISWYQKKNALICEVSWKLLRTEKPPLLFHIIISCCYYRFKNLKGAEKTEMIPLNKNKTQPHKHKRM